MAIVRKNGEAPAAKAARRAARRARKLERMKQRRSTGGGAVNDGEDSDGDDSNGSSGSDDESGIDHAGDVEADAGKHTAARRKATAHVVDSPPAGPAAATPVNGGGEDEHSADERSPRADEVAEPTLATHAPTAPAVDDDDDLPPAHTYRAPSAAAPQHHEGSDAEPESAGQVSASDSDANGAPRKQRPKVNACAAPLTPGKKKQKERETRAPLIARRGG